MLDLSPIKILIIVVVVLILLGPDKLPQVARQIGAGWRQLKGFHARVEQEVRESIPDLPSSQDIARIARSPVALLNQLAEMPSSTLPDAVADPAAPDHQAEVNGSDGHFPVDPSAETAGSPAATELSHSPAPTPEPPKPDTPDIGVGAVQDAPAAVPVSDLGDPTMN